MAWLVVVTIEWSWYLIPSLEYCLVPELGLTHMQFTLILVGPFLIAAFTAILGGALADRYGIRLIVAIAIFIAGITGLIRAFTLSIEVMLALMCLFGISFSFAITNIPKLVAIWFPPKQVGRMTGFCMSGIGVGLSLGLLTGPLFGGWRPAFTYIGILTLVIAILWTLFARNAPEGIKIHMPPIISSIKRGIRSKNVWLAGIMMSLSLGAFIAFSSNFPQALERVHHISPKMAGAVSSLITFGSVAGNLLIPMLSDKRGLRKPFIYGSVTTSAICLFFAWQLAPNPIISILAFLSGFGFGSMQPIILALPVELPEIGHDYVGGASGIVASLANMGGFLIPLMVMSPLVTAGTLKAYTNGFSVILILLAAIALVAIPLMETGIKVKFRK